MRFFKPIAILMIAVSLLTLSSCRKVNKKYGVQSDAQITESVADQKVLPEIISLDSKMSKYFDISLFDEENYSDIYLGRKYEIKANFAGTDFSVPTTIEEISANGWKLLDGSDYDENSLIYAKETVELKFKNEDGAKITALFYNSSNSSIRLFKCDIVKFRISNNYFKNKEKYSSFNVNGVTNTSVVTDVISILGTPSHFYKKTENTYYFDYFIKKSDRRNKIRVYVDLEDDAVTAVEFSKYK